MFIGTDGKAQKTINNKRCSAFERDTETNPFKELLQQYLHDVCTMHTHLFHLEWQIMQFGNLIETIQEGEVLFVIDFAKNFSHVFQDEPQSAHWDRMQSTMYPLVSYYKCICGSTITDELMFFTADLKHNAQAIENFEKRTTEHLKERNVNLKCIYEFSDNCSGQYKSKNPFKILSESNIPIMRNFHCEKHRKCVADGTVGRTNQFVYCAI